jgi:hypothetical protein
VGTRWNWVSGHWLGLARMIGMIYSPNPLEHDNLSNLFGACLDDMSEQRTSEGLLSGLAFVRIGV